MKTVAREGFKETLPGVLSRVVGCILVTHCLVVTCIIYTASIMEIHWSSDWFLYVRYVKHVTLHILVSAMNQVRYLF